jgi:hypothetical protein
MSTLPEWQMLLGNISEQTRREARYPGLFALRG